MKSNVINGRIQAIGCLILSGTHRKKLILDLMGFSSMQMQDLTPKN